MVATQPTQQDDIKTLADLIKETRIAIFSTVLPDGTIHSRPMGTQAEPFDGTAWFFTDVGSEKTHEIKNDQHVNVSYANPSANTYVCMIGKASVVHDRVKAKQLWTPFMKAWFPKGVEDPSLALIRVDVEQAEYWSGPSSTLVKIAGLAKALITGQRINPGKNEKIDLDAVSSPS